MKLVDYAQSLANHYATSELRATIDQTFLPNLANTIRTHPALKPHIHSVKFRSKDPQHLFKKLMRKAKKLKGPQRITSENLFRRVNDLAGLRILHLYTRQIAQIDAALKTMFDESHYRIKEGPFARTWDDESRDYFSDLGIKIEKSPTLYTSVHYVIAPNKQFTCEIQVRTLMEEVWGEIDHAINYPDPSDSVACREQLRALARATSSCSRLVDAIVASHADHVATD